MTSEAEYLSILLQDPVDGIGVRVDKTLASKWLRENKSIICGGNVFYLKIRNMRLGIFNVTKAPLNIRSTYVVK